MGNTSFQRARLNIRHKVPSRKYYASYVTLFLTKTQFTLIVRPHLLAVLTVCRTNYCKMYTFSHYGALQ